MVKTPVCDKGEHVIGILCSVQDITERKRMELELREHKEHLEELVAERTRALQEQRLLIDNILASTPASVFWKDRDSVYLGGNEQFARDAGLANKEDIAGKSDYELAWTKAEADDYLQCDRRIMDSGQPVCSLEVTQHRADGTEATLLTSKVPLRDIDGNVTGVLGVYMDITGRKVAEEQLRLAASVFHHAHEGIIITDVGQTIIDVNESFSRITGYSREELLDQHPSMLRSGHHGSEFYASMWRDLVIKGYWQGEVWDRRKDGEVYAVLVTISAVRDEKFTTRNYIAIYSDITIQKQYQKQLEYLAHYDALTNLPNRVLLSDRLHQAMAQSQRYEYGLMVAYLDLDGFKEINDTHGHLVGDKLLTTVAIHLKEALREGDTIARIGGDEFVAVLVDLVDVEAGIHSIKRLIDAAARPVRVGNLVLHISTSIGTTFYPQQEDIDADQLLRQADQAMYQAKLAGKNCYQLFDQE